MANNPLKFIDPDGKHIVILWEVDGEKKTMIYSYKEDRTFEKGTPEFVENTLKSLDQLYLTGALEIVMNEGEEPTDLMEAFMGSREHHVLIQQNPRTVYRSDKNTIRFDDKHGSFSKIDVNEGLVGSNIVRNSASSGLGHEMIHAYNDEFDHDDYTDRRNEKYESTKENLFFTNKEEIKTTLR